jgi:hypothetical protein
VTAILLGDRSPTRRQVPATGPQRGPACPRLSQSGGGEGLATLSDPLAAAQRRAARRRNTVTCLQASGAHKQAFNEAVQALRAALAREFTRRPGEATALYEYFAGLMLTWAAQAPSLVVETAPAPAAAETGGAR